MARFNEEKSKKNEINSNTDTFAKSFFTLIQPNPYACKWEETLLRVSEEEGLEIYASHAWAHWIEPAVQMFQTKQKFDTLYPNPAIENSNKIRK
jgi:hypothetical protein